MPTCSARPRPLHDTARLALGLTLSFGGALVLVRWAGPALIDSLLSTTAWCLGAIDDRFAILALDRSASGQDAVLHLRANLVRPLLLGGRLQWPIPAGWVDVSTPIGLLLQPLTVALGLVGAWPGSLAVRLRRLAGAVVLAVAFLLIDLPLTLHASVWDIFVQGLDPRHVSGFIAWRDLMQGGGRLAVGILLAIAVCRTGVQVKRPRGEARTAQGSMPWS